MEINQHELTEQGLQELKSEIKHLREVTRIENIKALQEARAQGDLSENADYDAAREQQGRINTRITEIENILKNYIIIKTTKSGMISTGSTVKIDFDGVLEEYEIIGTLQANPLDFKLSNQSPLGKALLGKIKGDTVHYKSETNKEFKVKVIEVN